VDQRVLDELMTTRGVLQVALLDRDGFVKCTSPQHEDTADRLALAVGPLDASKANRITVQGELACVMAERLKGDRVVVLKCQTDCNLGSVRSALGKAIASLNASMV
jgi:predicted regulator of Ras-like GTPase activity (Roadblock/LC7/MglB family)